MSIEQTHTHTLPLNVTEIHYYPMSLYGFGQHQIQTELYTQSNLLRRKQQQKGKKKPLMFVVVSHPQCPIFGARIEFRIRKRRRRRNSFAGLAY